MGVQAVEDINFIRMFSVHTPVEGGKLGVYYSSLLLFHQGMGGEGGGQFQCVPDRCVPV
jgi:hypothetical protein